MIKMSLVLSVVLACAACGSVEVPEANAYRLELPVPAGGELPRGGVLRVGEITLAADLRGDGLLVQDGPVRVRAFRHHRWAGPLESLVADAVVTGLERSRCFALVKSDTASGGEDYLLTGRVLEFHQAGRDGRWCGRATLGLTLVDSDRRPLFQREFSAETVLDGDAPEDLVVALSRSLASIVDQVVTGCDAVGVFPRPLDAAPGR